MLLWAFAFLSLFAALKTFGQCLSLPQRAVGLRQAGDLLRELEETLVAGWVPSSEKWTSLKSLPDPWGSLAWQSVSELRSQGGALLPTLRRLRVLVREHGEALKEARSRSAQALAQAVACSLMVPLFGGALYLLLPGVDGHPWLWCVACATASLGAGLGALWMVRLAEAARWGGLPPRLRNWTLAALCAGERLLARVRAGTPADVAWNAARELLEREAPGLETRWGHSVWTGPSDDGPPVPLSARPIVELGHGLRKAVQLSLMEGRPCAERIETELQSLKHATRTGVEREIALLGNRALKPLFICVAPSLLGLLAFGFFITWRSSIA